jgi:hypothetical protein
MQRTRWLSLGAALLALLLPAPMLSAAPPKAPPAAPSLDQVPAGAPLVIQFHGIERTKDRFLAMLKNALPEQEPMVRERLESVLKEGNKGRKLQGLAPDGPIFVVLTALPEAPAGLVPPGSKEGSKKESNCDETPDASAAPAAGKAPPKIAVLAHVTDYKEFRDGLLTEDERKNLKSESGYEEASLDNGEKIYFVDHHGYAVVTPRQDVAEEFTKEHKGLKLPDGLAERLLKPDIGVYVDMVAINKQYGPLMKKWRDAIDKAFDQASASAPKGKGSGETPDGAKPAPGAGNPLSQVFGNQKQLAAVLHAELNAIFQMASDSREVVSGIEFHPDGLALHKVGLVAPNTPTDKVFKGASQSAFEDIERLPAGQVGYIGMQTDPEFMKVASKLQDLMTSNSDSKAFTEARKELEAAGPRSFVAAFNIPPSGLQVWQYEDPAKAVAAQLKMFQGLESGSSFHTAFLKEKPEVKEDAENHRGFKLNQARIVWDWDKAFQRFQFGGSQAPPELKEHMVELLKKEMGESMSIWFGTDGKRYVVVTGPNWKAAQHELDNYLDGKHSLGQEAGFKAVRKQLPKEATLLALVDLTRYVETSILPFVKAAAEAAGAKGASRDEEKPERSKASRDKPAEESPAAEKPTGEKPAAHGHGEASYVGIAVRLQPERGSYEFWVPATTVHNLAQLLHKQGGARFHTAPEKPIDP